jgi:hypothetical protein
LFVLVILMSNVSVMAVKLYIQKNAIYLKYSFFYKENSAKLLLFDNAKYYLAQQSA